jgi:glycerophosphoryl diester phosphodiesterase
MADAPENTIEAFRRALKQGASGLESDVRLARDGEAVLVHDPVIRAGLRRVRVRDTTVGRLAELDVPTLAELYQELGTEFDLSLDVADRDAALAAVAIARTAQASARLWVCSPDLEVLDAVRDADTDVRLVHSTRSKHVGPYERHAADVSRAGIAAVNFHQSDWSLGLVTLYHRFGLLAFGWDAQETRHLRALLGMKIDAVYSDHVDRMVATVAEWTELEKTDRP